MYVPKALTAYQVRQLTLFCESSVDRPHQNAWGHLHKWSVNLSNTDVQELNCNHSKESFTYHSNVTSRLNEWSE